MRTQSDLFRLTSLLAMSGLLAGPALTQRAWAQAAPPPPGAPAPDAQPAADPPARVGRLALVTGAVSFHTPSDTDWSPASLNYPVVGGNSFWTEPGAEADLELGGTVIAMNASTELDLATLDDTGATATVAQGEVYAQVRSLQPNETIALQTPRGTVTIAAPGQYDVVAGDTANPTVVTVISGAAQVGGANLTLSVGPGQAATLTGADTYQGSVGPAAQDAFSSAMLAREQPRPVPVGSAAPPPVVAEMPGGAELAAVGVWAAAPEYGQVWYPPVAAGWVPYRNGHWAYVAPWGWTWVDDAPWGFAPFHYGRWTYIGNRWGWVPGGAVGVVARPVYAPALVTFFGVGVGAVGVGVAIGGSVGWLPLGPGEVYRPWYHASDQYVRNVNVRNVTNVTTINNTTINNTTINTYHNSRFATVVPAAALADSRPVARSVRPVSAQELAAARPVVAQEPVRPTAATAGVTPGVARQLHIQAAPGAVAPRVAPGPAVHPVAQAAAGRPAVVPLRPAATPAVARPGQPVAHPAEVPHGPAPSPPAQPTPAVVGPGPAVHPTEPAARSGQPAPPAAEHPAVARPGQPVEHPAEAPHAPAPSTPAHPAPAVVAPGPAVHPTESAVPPGQHAPPAVEHPAAAKPATAGVPSPHPAEVPHPAAPVVQHPAAPPPVAHPEPAVRPAAAPSPAPVAHPAPEVRPAPAPHPAPQPHPEEKKPDEKKPGQP